VIIDSTGPAVTITFPEPGGKNGWFVSSPVVGTVAATDASGVEALTCTGGTLGLVAGGTASLTVAGEGVHDVRCTATDGVGNGSDAAATVKIDTTAPAVTCSGNPPTLWPPDHGLVDVTTTVAVDGGASGAAGAVLTQAASSEPDDGLGDGDTADDLQGWEIGTADTTGRLRAERSGTGAGRVYTLTYTGADGAGNTSTCAVTVKVTHDQGK
jgi:hypothetical protein